jgi:hypothetical protein
MKNKTYYPQIIAKYSPNKWMSLETTLRKLHDGVWYCWEVYRKYELNPGDDLSDDYLKYGMLHDEIYFAQVLGIVDPDCVGARGNHMFKVDELQISEAERLRKTYPHLKK